MKKLLNNPLHISMAISIITGLLLFIFTNFIPDGKKWELSAYDFRLNLLGKINNIDDKIVIIGIDQDTVKEMGVPAYKRTIYAGVVKKISTFNPLAIAFDMEFDTYDKYNGENDKIFGKEIKKSGRVILAYSFSQKGPSLSPVKEYEITEPIKVLSKNASYLGYVRIDPDLDGTIRKVKLAFFDGKKWHLQFEVAIMALLENIKAEEIRFEKSRIIIGNKIIETDEDYQIYINYQTVNILSSSSSYVELSPVSFKDINAITPLQKSIFLIGSYCDETGDYHKTPLKREFGVKIHANILNTILKNCYIYRASRWINLILIILIAIICGFSLYKFNAKIGIFITSILLTGFIIINFIMFYRGIWIELYSPSMTILISFSFIEAYQFLRTYKLFSQFLPGEYVDRMLTDSNNQKLGGQEIEATVLFSDIRGYTNLSENLKSHEVMDMLNQYHTRMSCIFKENNGRVFDYQGDAQMVVFGAMNKGENHALNAVKCGLSMQLALADLVHSWQMDGKYAFDVGIGICTGPVALGFVGSEEHKQLAAIGDTTNTAARLQGLSKQLDSPITITKKAYDYIKDFQEDFVCEELEPVSVKGKKEPLQVYRVKRKI